MSRSVMDLKEVCLELCAGGILIKAMELVKLPNYQSLDPVEFLYECLVSEAARRQTRKVATQIKKSACFYPDACIENCQASFKLTPENELTPTNATH